MGKNIQTGDIVIFDGGDNWISKSICWLTRSTVSHAAMVYEGETIVEMGMGGISVSGFEAENGGDAHIMRLLGDKPAAPLAAAAKRYIDEGVSYDFPALILLAGLLIYKGVRPTPRWQRVTDTVLTLAGLAADKLLNEIVQKGSNKKAMVCSQLVYQIYLDCGKEYTIEIGKLLEAPVVDQAVNADGSVTLANLLETRQDAKKDTKQDAEDYGAVQFENAEDMKALLEIDREALYRELYEALTEEGEQTALDSGQDQLELTEGSLSDILDKAKAFLDKMEQLLELVHLDVPIPALFVTPADLYEKAANLEHVGDVHITRIKK